jgi:hypothetical protein
MRALFTHCDSNAVSNKSREDKLKRMHGKIISPRGQSRSSYLIQINEFRVKHLISFLYVLVEIKWAVPVYLAFNNFILTLHFFRLSVRYYLEHKIQLKHILFIFSVNSSALSKRSAKNERFRNRYVATPRPPGLKITCFMKVFGPRTCFKAFVLSHLPPFVLVISEKIFPALLLWPFKIGNSVKRSAWVRGGGGGDRPPPEE